MINLIIKYFVHSILQTKKFKKV